MEMVPQKALFTAGSMKARDYESSGQIRVNEIYLDGKLKTADMVDEDEKSYGIFMHSLILSNYAEVMKVDNSHVSVIGDDAEKAIYSYAASRGFDKRLMESIAPKVDGMSLQSNDCLRVSAHLINEKIRIVSKGTPEELMKRCSYILLDSKFVKITRRIYRETNFVLRDMLGRCLNVYAIAIKDVSKVSEALSLDACVSGMTLVALVGVAKA